jgi:hypothetical protein
MEERRASQRRRTLKIGTIAFNRSAAITARVKNISDTGAGLEVDSIVGIPDEFVLDITSDHFRRPCRMVWKTPTRMGVCFTQQSVLEAAAHHV